MTAPTGFQERLRTELVDLVGTRRAEPAPRRHRAWWIAVPAGLTAAAVVAALAAGPPHGQPSTTPAPVVIDEVSYGIELKPDGVVEISLVDPAGAKALERKLNELGIPAVVMVSSPDCTEASPEPASTGEDIVVGFGSRRNGMLIRPSLIPPDAHLMIVYEEAGDQFPNPGPAMFGIFAVKAVPGRIKLERPANVPPRGSPPRR